MNSRRYRIVALSIALCACDSSSVPVNMDGGTDGSDGPGACAEGTYRCAQTGNCEAEVKTCETEPQCIDGEEVDYGAGPYMDEETCAPIPQRCSCKELEPLKPGMIGRYASLTAAGDRLVASAYDSTFGDLVVVSASTSDLTALSYESVDGVPDATPTAGRSGYRGGVSAAGDDVGTQTAIARTSSGTLFIAYHDVTHRALKLARSLGDDQGWSTHVVAAPTDDREIVGRYLALTLVDDKPAIAFLVLNKDAKDGSFISQLTWAETTVAEPRSMDDWQVSTIESAPMPCRNLCEQGSACFLESDGTSKCKKVDSGCSGCATEEACLAGQCAAILPETTVQEPPRATGLWPALATAKQGVLLAYHDSIAGALKVALRSGGEWQRRPVKVNASNDAFGAFCSLAVDDAGIAHIAHQNASRETLAYVQLDPAAITAAATATLTPKVYELIDDGARPEGKHPVGADSAIAISASGTPRVIYQDQLTADLLAVERKGPNAWTPADAVDPDLGRKLKGGDAGYGFYSALTAVADKLYGVTFYFDTANERRGGLEFFALP